jgi:hypothetical protein
MMVNGIRNRVQYNTNVVIVNIIYVNYFKINLKSKYIWQLREITSHVMHPGNSDYNLFYFKLYKERQPNPKI